MAVEQEPRQNFIADVELAKTSEFLVEQAVERALDSSDGSSGAVKRIKNGIYRRFKPYSEENWVIADQLTNPVYTEFVDETKGDLNARVGAIICSDGRIAIIAYGDPLVINAHRRLQGLPQTRRSTRNTREWVLDDADLAASINTEMAHRRMTGLNPEIVEFLGQHIYSMDPSEGCGAFKNKILSRGHTVGLGMRNGGVPEFFAELGDAFFAFDNNARRAGGSGTTIDLVHDAYSEGLIFGLRDAAPLFHDDYSLRHNLTSMAQEGRILMAETLSRVFGQRAQDLAKSMGLQARLDIKTPEKFAENAMTIGTVARALTDQQYNEGLEWMPEHLLNDLSEAAHRIKVYTAVRNYVYTELCGIRPGRHDLLRHPETLVVVGPTTALYNRENIPFVQKTHPGLFGPDEVASSKALYNLRGSVMEEEGIDMEEEGRIIVATGEYDSSIYKDEATAMGELNRVASIVRNNAAMLREEYAESVKTGEAIVLGALHAPVTRKIIAMV